MPPTSKDIGSFTYEQPGGYAPTINLSHSLGQLLSNILGIITMIAGVAFIFYFMIGAINWITSAGDTNKIQTARGQILNAIIGLAITALAYPTAYVLSQLLGVPFKNPIELITSFTFI